MPEPSEYKFSLVETAKALLRESGINEGLWMIGFEVNISIGNFGQQAADAKPGVLVQISSAKLTRAPADVSADDPLVVDAAALSHGAVDRGAKSKSPPRAARKR